MNAGVQEQSIRAIRRPHPKLLTYFTLGSLMLGPLFPVLLVPRFFRYWTLRYEFGDQGISMRWGALFRREIHLTYARIQDIHLHSNVFERWLGLARVLIETASGSSKAEMTIEGVLQFEALRDFIYGRMAGTGDEAGGSRPVGVGSAEPRELAAVLENVADELREIRRLLERHVEQ